jgi:uncharacterized membrane protein YfcA
MHHIVLLAAAGLLAGAMNAVAGGGSFVSFPAMVAAGLPTVIANASSTVALFPGSVTSAVAYRREFASIADMRLGVMLPISVAGGLAGAAMLIATPVRLFDAVMPFLLLLATLIFAVGARAGLVLHRVARVGRPTLLALQFLIAVYGGYFGGAVGLMMMATWSLLTANADLKAMAPARVLLVSATNGAAVLWFIAAGAVRWPETLAMLGTSVVGGYLGAQLARWLPAATVRGFVVVLTATVTAVFFARVM